VGNHKGGTGPASEGAAMPHAQTSVVSILNTTAGRWATLEREGGGESGVNRNNCRKVIWGDPRRAGIENLQSGTKKPEPELRTKEEAGGG